MLLRPILPNLTPFTLTTFGLGISVTALHLHRQRRTLLCEQSSPLDAITQQYLHTSRSGPTTSRAQGGKQNSTSKIIRQLSLGSVLGVLGGVAVSTFSRVLAVLFGLGVVVVQVCYRVVRIGPKLDRADSVIVCGVQRVQRYTRGKDTKIRERDKLEESGGGESGVQVELWDDLCVGVTGEVLAGRVGRSALRSMIGAFLEELEFFRPLYSTKC